MNESGQTLLPYEFLGANCGLFLYSGPVSLFRIHDKRSKTNFNDEWVVFPA